MQSSPPDIVNRNSRSFERHPSSSDLLFAGTAPSDALEDPPRVATSSDGGQTWTVGASLREMGYSTSDLVGLPSDPQRILAAIGDAVAAGAARGIRPMVFLSQDRGATWLDKTGNLWDLWADSEIFHVRRVTAIQADWVTP